MNEKETKELIEKLGKEVEKEENQGKNYLKKGENFSFREDDKSLGFGYGSNIPYRLGLIGKPRSKEMVINIEPELYEAVMKIAEEEMGQSFADFVGMALMKEVYVHQRTGGLSGEADNLAIDEMFQEDLKAMREAENEQGYEL